MGKFASIAAPRHGHENSAMVIRHGRQFQHGAALLMFLVLLVMASLTAFLANLTPASSALWRDRKTSEALAKAKEAIIAWSVSNPTLPGRLPCPEDTSLIGQPTEGQARSSCNSLPPPQTWIGRLPWRTLGIGELRDGYGEPLWYAISDGFRNAPINLNTPALLSLDGAPANIVAIVFSAGPALSGQARPPINAATPPAIANYLDSSNADGDASFVSHGNGVLFNDKLLPITHDELFRALGHRVAQEIRGDDSNGLQRYFLNHANTLPFAADIPLGVQGTNSRGFIPYGDPDILYPGSGYLNANGWFALVGYQRYSNNQATVTIGAKSYAFTFQ